MLDVSVSCLLSNVAGIAPGLASQNALSCVEQAGRQSYQLSAKMGPIITKPCGWPAAQNWMGLRRIPQSVAIKDQRTMSLISIEQECNTDGRISSAPDTSA
jgi:hypothetical protein